MPFESVILSNHFILCCPLLLLPSIFPSIRVFSNELLLHIKWPKYWSFSFSVSPFNEYSGLISFTIDWWQVPVCSWHIPVWSIQKSMGLSCLNAALGPAGTQTFSFSAAPSSPLSIQGIWACCREEPVLTLCWNCFFDLLSLLLLLLFRP